ncbi:MAG: TetR/AcrR family transcriptional regulator [Acidimicrobiales bacterium]|nr:TetR/AcrR family transcriptional regulator [Acidimicrobiales bacterium]MCB1251580.1 TetR/AcrR family transcriptional regulator [Acidimicrobiales bacterium]MCB1261639.1 TetR/AcrR family transcriptional regulator [Acidimicrobiales bacterium]
MSVSVDSLIDADEPATKGERTRRRLLELAIERFGTKGFRATSVSEIARAAELTQAAAYAYFDNKEALFRAAVDADASGLIEHVTDQVRDLPVNQLIPSVIVHAVLALEEHPLAKRILSGAEPDEIPRLIDLPALSQLAGMLSEALADGQTRGEVRADLDPAVLGPGLESLIMGLLFSAVLSAGDAQPRHVLGVVEAFDLMIRPPA